MSNANRHEVEELLCSCLERPEPEWQGAVEEACASHPWHADALRQVFATILRLGGTAGDGEELEAIPHHRIVRHLGKGGMGTVYLAEQLEPLRRLVAVKLIKPGMDTGMVVRRFEVERQALARLQHPNVAAVFGAGATARGRPFFTMEFVQGEPLLTFCDRRRLDLRSRLRIFVDVCAGVQHAHEHGVLHRDVKPANVIVACHGGRIVPKVIDFGLARAIGECAVGASTVTLEGTFIGTPEYMSPEQASGSSLDLDVRTDVYALGVTLFELVVGSLPQSREALVGRLPTEVARLIAEREAPRPSTHAKAMPGVEGRAAARSTSPRALVAALRGDLDWILLKALSRDRHRRYASVSEFATDIEAHLAQLPIKARPPSWLDRVRRRVRRNRVLSGAGAAAFLSFLGGAVWTWPAAADHEATPPAAIGDAPDRAAVTILDRSAPWRERWRQDRAELEVLWRAWDERCWHGDAAGVDATTWLQRAERLQGRLAEYRDLREQLRGLGDERSSGDEASFWPYELVSIDAAGRHRSGDCQYARPTADGLLVAFVSSASLLPTDRNGDKDIYVHDRASGDVELISMDADGSTGDGPSISPSISGDGRFVVFESTATNLASGLEPGTRSIFVRDRWSATTSRALSLPVGPADQACQPELAGNGRYVVFRTLARLAPRDDNGRADIYRLDLATGAVDWVSVGVGGAAAEGRCKEGRLSGDGRRVVFCSDASNLVPGDPSAGDEVFVRDMVTGTTTPVARGLDGSPAQGRSNRADISLDGRYVSFTSNAANLVSGDRNRTDDIFVCDLETGRIELVSISDDGQQGDVNAWSSRLSRHARFVVFEANLPPACHREREIYCRDREAGRTYCLTACGGRATIGEGGAYRMVVAADAPVVFFEAGFGAGPNATLAVMALSLPAESSGPRLAVARPGNAPAHVSINFNACSDDGRWVSADCGASLLFAGGRSHHDSFLADWQSGTVSVLPPRDAAYARQGLRWLDQGRRMVFMTDAPLVAEDVNEATDIYLVDPDGSNLQLVCAPDGTSLPKGALYGGAADAGNAIPFQSESDGVLPGDDAGLDVFLWRPDRTICLSAPSPSHTRAWEPVCSPDGRWIVFNCDARLSPEDVDDACDIYLFDAATGTRELVSVGVAEAERAPCFVPSVSGDGRYVAFHCDIGAWSGVFVRDREQRCTELVSHDRKGGRASGKCHDARISRNGRFVLFEGGASALVPGDRNDWEDLFLHDRLTRRTIRVSVDALGRELIAPSEVGLLSADGATVFFETRGDATGLWRSDSEHREGYVRGTADLWERDRRLHELERRRVVVFPFAGTTEHQAVSALIAGIEKLRAESGPTAPMRQAARGR